LGGRDTRHTIDKDTCDTLYLKLDFITTVVGSLDWLRAFASRFDSMEALWQIVSEKFRGEPEEDQGGIEPTTHQQTNSRHLEGPGSKQPV
jgi:hypothetical protein